MSSNLMQSPRLIPRHSSATSTHSMTVYLVSLFHIHAKALDEFARFRTQRLDLVHAQQGTVTAIFRPAGRGSAAVPDEIHIIEFPSGASCQAFRANALAFLGELQSRAIAQFQEYESDVLIPTESVLATMITRRPVFPPAEAEPAPSLTEALTQTLPRPTHAELTFAQRQAALDTVILQPQSPAQKKLSALVKKWQSARDRRVVFAHTYFLMTTNMLDALKAGQFHDRAWVGGLLDRFAEYYFDALEKFEEAPHNAPSVWRVAFEVAKNPDTFVVQHLLLGVNAHINYDLSSSLIDVMRDEWPTYDAIRKRQRYEDHTRVNDIIATTFDDAQELVIARYSPSLDRLMHAAMAFDEIMVSSLITSWREQAWQQAVEFLNAGSWEARHAARQRAEYHALRRADMIMLRQGPVKMKLLF